MSALRGERAIFRPTASGHLPALLRLWNDGRLMRWVGFPDGLGCVQAKQGLS